MLLEKDMNKLTEDETKILLKKYKVLVKCDCGGISVPNTVTITVDIEDDIEKDNKLITVHNFPVRKCLRKDCDEWTYSAQDYIDAYNKAKNEYEKSERTEISFDEK